MTFCVKDFLPGDVVRDRDGWVGEVEKVGRKYIYIHFQGRDSRIN
jgi:hypothetical protein